MISHLTRQLLSLLTCAILLISCIPVGVLAETEDPAPCESQTAEPLPEPSEPPVSEPTESASTEPEEPEPSAPEPSEPGSSEPQSAEPVSVQAEPEIHTPAGPGLYFGLLHAHSDISDGAESIETVFQTAATVGLDFLILTDHSDSFDGHLSADIGTDGSAVSTDWAAGKAAAAAASTGSFAGILGYEMSWPVRMKIGHISTFGTPGFQSWMQEPYSRYSGALESYYDALSTVPGAVAQFNHPGTQYGTFNNFEYSAKADQVIQLIELDFTADDPCRYYTEALDKGWHLSPTGSREASDSVRTAVYAQALTETSILDTLRSRKTYATEDPDLEILYSMDGFPMGSTAKLRQIGDTMDITVTLRDPTDSAVGLVEVFSGNSVLSSQILSAPEGTLVFSLPAAAGYYYLKITQPDGDRAVTAPIWIDDTEHLGISGVSCETAAPVQNEQLTLVLTLFNRESSPLLVDSLEIYADGIPVFADSALTRIPTGELVHRVTFSCHQVGTTTFTVKLTGTLDASPRTYEASLTLSLRQSKQVTSVLADSGHGNAGLNDLQLLSSLAEKNNIRFTAGTVTSDSLKDCRFLLVSAPSVPFSDDFLEAAAEFVGYGGSLVLCGQSDTHDASVHSSAELNRLLAAVGSSMRFGDNTVQDPVNHLGSPDMLNSDLINTDAPLCDAISSHQVFHLENGCTVVPGSGTRLVKGRPTTLATDEDADGLGAAAPGTTTLMAQEMLSGGGTVIAAGSLFLNDTGLAEPADIRDPGYANRTILKNLLGIGGDPVPLSTIRDARAGADGELFRIRGYVTAGTSNPHNHFPDTLYLQDDTGGVAITPFRESGIQIGTRMEITGHILTLGGNRVLKLSNWDVLDPPANLSQPQSGNWKTLLNPEFNGGTLVEVTGVCQEVYCRESDNTLSGCLLKDDHGNLAKIQIDDGIFAGSDGKNDLHETIGKKRTVWAMGLLHVNENGETVIRVRNCEEVAWIPPGTYLNPKTGSLLPMLPGICMMASLFFLFLLSRKRRI